MFKIKNTDMLITMLEAESGEQLPFRHEHFTRCLADTYRACGTRGELISVLRDALRQHYPELHAAEQKKIDAQQAARQPQPSPIQGKSKEQP